MGGSRKLQLETDEKDWWQFMSLVFYWMFGAFGTAGNHSSFFSLLVIHESSRKAGGQWDDVTRRHGTSREIGAKVKSDVKWKSDLKFRKSHKVRFCIIEAWMGYSPRSRSRLALGSDFSSGGDDLWLRSVHMFFWWRDRDCGAGAILSR